MANEKVTKDTLIGDLLSYDKKNEITAVLMGCGMHCLGCAIAKHETVGEAAVVHGLEVQDLIDRINAVID